MSARLISLATVVATAVGATVLPLAGTALAADSAAAGKPLSYEVGAVTPAGPLTRGGASGTYTFTVKNGSDQAADFTGTVFGDSEGASPIAGSQVRFDVEELGATPATDAFAGQQDESFMGAFYPAAGKKGGAFSVPAHGALTWKVTVGLAADFPSNDGNLKLVVDAGNDVVANPRAGDVNFKASPAIEPGALDVWFGDGPEGVVRPGTPQDLGLYYEASGGGEFDSALATTLRVQEDGSGRLPHLAVDVRQGDRWVALPGGDDATEWELPRIDKGFDKADQVRSTRIRVRVLDLNGVQKDTKVLLRADVRLTAGNTYPFVGSEGTVVVGPAKTSGGGQPSASPSTTPSSGASATPSASASATVSATPSASATAADGSLANTGAGNGLSGAMAAAAALLAGGAALAWFGIRRRRSHS